MSFTWKACTLTIAISLLISSILSTMNCNISFHPEIFFMTEQKFNPKLN
ncbi:hypothetical protein ATK78_2791 [Pedobacter metabolipauper]|uniref:Uncharacterized protein n=1 Tax=Pedobacter metabolipauper TaxID=425513 RepID=A0A4R6STM8_9SPHI|nr:hypothetical protein ATK78_2791 [Pedobacter metabolipauper]